MDPGIFAGDGKCKAACRRCIMRPAAPQFRGRSFGSTGRTQTRANSRRTAFEARVSARPCEPQRRGRAASRYPIGTTGRFKGFIFEALQSNCVTLGNRISARRRALGWSQNELARRAGVNHPTLFKIEADQRLNPSISIVVRIARALGTTAEALYGWERDDTRLIVEANKNDNARGYTLARQKIRRGLASACEELCRDGSRACRGYSSRRRPHERGRRGSTVAGSCRSTGCWGSGVG